MAPPPKFTAYTGDASTNIVATDTPLMNCFAFIVVLLFDRSHPATFNP
jgi:hypothetical protein